MLVAVAEQDLESISVKDWDRNGLGTGKSQYASGRPLWARKLPLNVRNLVFLPASTSVTEGGLWSERTQETTLII